MAEYQEAILTSPAQITFTEACTKSGKTLSHSWWNVEGAHKPIMPGAECLWIAPSHSQARMVFEQVARSYGPSGLYDINASSMTIRTPMGGVLAYLTGEKPNLIYGRSNVQQIVVDEYTRCRPELFDVCVSMLTATGGPLKMIGNYIGNANWGHVLKERMRGDPRCECFTITATDAVKAGIMKQERVDFARKTLHPASFAALYMCEGSAHPLQMMHADAINDLWTNTGERGERCMVVDVAGEGQDRTVVSVWDGLHLENLYVEAKSRGPELVAIIDSMAKMEKVGRSRIVVDCDGIGGMGVADYLKGCVRFHGGGKVMTQEGDEAANFQNLRTQCYYLLAELVNSRAISINPDLSEHRVDISLELEAIRRKDDMAEGKLKIAPKEEIKEMIGRSPDFPDVMMMRMIFELRGTGQMNTSLYRKADTFERMARRDAFRNFRPR